MCELASALRELAPALRELAPAPRELASALRELASAPGELASAPRELAPCAAWVNVSVEQNRSQGRNILVNSYTLSLGELIL